MLLYGRSYCYFFFKVSRFRSNKERERIEVEVMREVVCDFKTYHTVGHFFTLRLLLYQMNNIPFYNSILVYIIMICNLITIYLYCILII